MTSPAASKPAKPRIRVYIGPGGSLTWQTTICYFYFQLVNGQFKREKK